MTYYNRKIPHVQHQSNIPRPQELKWYYWIWATSERQNVVWGPYDSYEQAQRAAMELSSPYEIAKLHTRNADVARPQLRAKFLGETGDVDQSFRRINWNKE